MMFYKLIAVSFLLLTPLFGYALQRLFGLHRLNIIFSDLALPVFMFEIFMVSEKFFMVSFVPHYLILLSLIAIGTTIWLLKKSPTQFKYLRFLKLFWRLSFIFTFFFYLALVAAIFII